MLIHNLINNFVNSVLRFLWVTKQIKEIKIKDEGIKASLQWEGMDIFWNNAIQYVHEFA